MQQDHPHQWPLRPSVAAHVAYQLCAMISDLVRDEAGVGMSHRDYLKLCGLATAAEVFSREAADWYGNLKGEDEDLLAGLVERYMTRVAPGKEGGDE